MVFVLQNIGDDVIGSTGGHFLAYDGLEQSIGVEFDTWPYPTPIEHPDGEDRNEIKPDHIAFLLDGDILNPVAGPVPAINGLPLDDGTWHSIWIEYDTVTDTEYQELSVYVDFELRLSHNFGDLEDLFGTKKVTWGFTAATGLETNYQAVRMSSTSFLEYSIRK